MIVRDPLIHFLVIGALLFAALSWLGRSAPTAERIIVTADAVADIARSAELVAGRPPTEQELKDLVAAEIRDEVYYRQALALGLDVGDDEVRRRLIEKMQYLTEDTVDPEPRDADLEAWFTANAERFRIPPLVTFDQIFFSPRMRGDSVGADAAEALVALRQGADAEEFGDSTPLAARFEDADADRIRILFGEVLADALFVEDENVWLGPYESDFGLHLVRIVGQSEARDPPFDEIIGQVREAYAAERLRAANEAAFESIRDGFDIAVEWQAGEEPEPWPQP